MVLFPYYERNHALELVGGTSSLTIFKHVFFFNLQELEIVMGDQHISFTTSKIGSLIDVNQCKYVLSFTCRKQEPVTYSNAPYFSTGLVVNDGTCNCLIKSDRFSIGHC